MSGVVLFWGLASVMLAAALLVVVLPLWSRAAYHGYTAEAATNLAVYRRRRAELDEERSAGVLDDDGYRSAMAELDRQFLEDEPAETRPGGGPGGRPWLLSVSLALLLPALALVIYGQVGGGRAALTGGPLALAGAERATVERLAGELVRRVRSEPDNGTAWLMLGRVRLALEDYPGALEAMSRARRLLGDEPAVLTGYARALALGGPEQQLTGRPRALLEAALDKDPDLPEALWLGGLAAAEAGDYGQALTYWQRLLAQQPPDSDTARMLTEHMRALRAQMPQSTPSAGDDSSAALSVRVDIAPALTAQINPDAWLYIYARDADAGGGPPLAVARRRAGQLPLTIELDQGMMPGRGLGDAERLMVVARVSRSGKPMPESGDLQGQAGPFMLSERRHVEIVIDRRLP